MKTNKFLSVLLLAATSYAQEAPEYFPLAKGNKWTYSTSFGPDMVLQVVGSETVNGVECAVLRRSIEGMGDSMEWLAVQDQALRCLQYKDARMEMTFGKPIVRLKLPVQTGDRWTSSTYDENRQQVTGAYTVESPVMLTIAGQEQETVKVSAVVTSAQGKMTVETWYQPGIGMVRQVYGQNGQQMVSELKAAELTSKQRALRTRPSPRQVEAGQRCPECAAAIKPGQKFCGECGAKAQTPKPAAGETCTGCGKKLVPGAKFCGECGAKAVGAGDDSSRGEAEPRGPSPR